MLYITASFFWHSLWKYECMQKNPHKPPPNQTKRTYIKAYRYSTGCCVAAFSSPKKGCFIEAAPRGPEFLFILLYFGRYASMSAAVCQIYDCAWQNYTRNYFSSMHVVMNHICANFLGSLFEREARCEVERVSFNAFV